MRVSGWFIGAALFYFLLAILMSSKAHDVDVAARIIAGFSALVAGTCCSYKFLDAFINFIDYE